MKYCNACHEKWRSVHKSCPVCNAEIPDYGPCNPAYNLAMIEAMALARQPAPETSDKRVYQAAQSVLTAITTIPMCQGDVIDMTNVFNAVRRYMDVLEHAKGEEKEKDELRMEIKNQTIPVLSVFSETPVLHAVESGPVDSFMHAMTTNLKDIMAHREQRTRLKEELAMLTNKAVRVTAMGETEPDVADQANFLVAAINATLVERKKLYYKNETTIKTLEKAKTPLLNRYREYIRDPDVPVKKRVKKTEREEEPEVLRKTARVHDESEPESDGESEVVAVE